MSYRPRVQEPLKINLRDGLHTLITTRPPGSGALLGFMINLLSGYKDLYPHEGKTNLDKAILYYHRMVESMKFGFARRFRLADELFEDVHDPLSFNRSSQFFVSGKSSEITKLEETEG